MQPAYEDCLCHELHHLRGVAFERQGPLPVKYEGINLDGGYRPDLVVDSSLILELQCVEHILPAHEAQLLTYLKMTGKRVGLSAKCSQNLRASVSPWWICFRRICQNQSN